MKTFKEFMIESNSEKFSPRIGYNDGDWNHYNNTDWNSHITDKDEDDEPTSGKSIHDTAMQKVSNQNKLNLRYKPALRKFLHNPAGVMAHFAQSLKNKMSAGSHYDGQNLHDLHFATMSNRLKEPVTVHVGLDHDPTGQTNIHLTHPHISSISPDTALGHAVPVNGVHHIVRVDLNQGGRYAVVGNSVEKDVGPVSNDTYKNSIVVPMGGTFKPSMKIETYTDKEGRTIHVHPMTHSI